MTSSTTLSVSDELATKLAVARPLLGLATARIFDAPPTTFARTYPEYLRAMHNVVVATVPLIDAARRRLRELDASTDPLVAPVAAFLDAHRGEEVGHDDLVLADLAALGLPPTFVTDRPPLPEAVDLVGAQYYVVNHVHPVVLLGHIFMSEGAPMAPARVADVIERSGLPAAAFGSLRLHGTLDVDHGAALAALLDTLPLDARLRAALGQNALTSVRHAAALLEHVARL